MPRDYKPRRDGKRYKRTEHNIIEEARDYKPRRDGKRYKRTEHNIIEEAKEDIRYGYSILVIQQHLNRAGRVVSRFKDNLPGK
ncbi:hypothetical protein QE152_g20748 [Popillia japonica]|uniref:Uncharacterized protein n=1 Tax=Popillia japonica TaxID=7064 RepID=A0AAW1KPC9_POPJA